MEFIELKYPESPIPRKKLLGGLKVPGYICKLYQNLDGPFFILEINEKDFMVKVSSLFKDIIEARNIQPSEGGKP